MGPEESEYLPPWGQPAAWEAPAGVAIWGARWIYPDDQLYDRQGFNEVEDGRDQLREWLNDTSAGIPDPKGTRITKAMEQAVELDRAIAIRQSSKAVVTLYEDEVGIIKANPSGSFGHLYVAAWLK